VSTAVLWSGGKDCFAAGVRAGAFDAAGTRLVTFVPAGEPAAFRCHPLPLMRAQAAALRLPHELVEIERADWEASYRAAFARLAGAGARRVVTGDITPEACPWLAAATAAAGLALETPLATLGDPAASLDVLAAAGAEATVSGMRADVYRPTFLGRQVGRALLDEHGLDEPGAFHPCGERGEYHTVVTAIDGRPLLAGDPATLAHLERDGIWALDWPATSTSDFL
jgi:diphthine-ammonia ligase